MSEILDRLTSAQRRALESLALAGGGVVNRYGRLIGYGHPEAHSEVKQFAPETWLRLIAHGFAQGGNGRIELTAKGRAAAERGPKS